MHPLRTSRHLLQLRISFSSFFDHLLHHPFSQQPASALIPLRVALCGTASAQFDAAPSHHGICIVSASAAIAGGFVQVVVSKAREHTVLVQTPCPFALPIQH